ncbi:MAG: BrnA antitoxin family protein, partial [Candidatus Contendobacter sp.]|nr:BrnA antitoxin family protein [Candidatus Contendobacter sp.]
EVVTWFRATGKGWQTRLDAALKEWIAQQPGEFHQSR